MANDGYDQITIQGQTFRVPLRYAAGHVLKENEAGALNQTLHENLRNNFAKKVAEGLEANTGMEVLQQQLDDYAAEYEFGVRGGGGGPRDPVRTLAMNVARDLIRRTLKSKGIDLDQWPASKISQAASQLLDSQGEDGRIISHARQQVEAEKAAAQAAMAEVGEIVDQANSAPTGVQPA
jgi:glucuronate isomerase